MSKTTPVKMSHPLLARINRLDQELQANRFPNCRKMAEELGVSAKTVQREFEYMRDTQGLPLAYDRRKHGYYYSEPVVDLPAVRISEGEVVALLIAQKALEQYRGTPFERTLDTAFKKITLRLRDEISFNPSEIMAGVSFSAFGASPADIETFKVLARAVRLSREVTVSYQKPGATAPEPRRVRPYHLANIQNLWYVIAYDVGKDDGVVRKFALPRMKAVHLEKTSFERPKNFSIKDYLSKSFGAFSGSENIEVKILFDPFAAGFIRERSWHPSEKFKLRRGGALELSMSVPRLEEVQNWVMSWGHHARVVAPKILANWVSAEATAIKHVYANEPTKPSRM